MSWKSVVPSLESGGVDLLKMGASGLLGYFLGRRSKRASIRVSTDNDAVNLLNEYNVILSAGEFPNSKFMNGPDDEASREREPPARGGVVRVSCRATPRFHERIESLREVTFDRIRRGANRRLDNQPRSSRKVTVLPQVGGLHHRYQRLAA